MTHREAYAVCRYCQRTIEHVWDDLFKCDVWATTGSERSYCQARAAMKVKNSMIGQRVSHEPTDLGVTYPPVVRGRTKSPATAALAP